MGTARCPICRQRVRLPDLPPGKRVRCPACGCGYKRAELLEKGRPITPPPLALTVPAPESAGWLGPASVIAGGAGLALNFIHPISLVAGPAAAAGLSLGAVGVRLGRRTAGADPLRGRSTAGTVLGVAGLVVWLALMVTPPSAPVVVPVTASSPATPPADDPPRPGSQAQPADQWADAAAGEGVDRGGYTLAVVEVARESSPDDRLRVRVRYTNTSPGELQLLSQWRLANGASVADPAGHSVSPGRLRVRQVEPGPPTEYGARLGPGERVEYDVLCPVPDSDMTDLRLTVADLALPGRDQPVRFRIPTAMARR